MKTFVNRPLESQAIIWETEADGKEIIEVLGDMGYLTEYHEPESNFITHTKEHILFGNIRETQGIVHGQVLIIRDGRAMVGETEEFLKIMMPEDEYQAMITSRIN